MKRHNFNKIEKERLHILEEFESNAPGDRKRKRGTQFEEMIQCPHGIYW